MTTEEFRSSPEARVELLDQLRRHLKWASRVNPNSPSRIELRRLFARADVLDLLEALITEAANVQV